MTGLTTEQTEQIIKPFRDAVSNIICNQSEEALVDKMLERLATLECMPTKESADTILFLSAGLLALRMWIDMTRDSDDDDGWADPDDE